MPFTQVPFPQKGLFHGFKARILPRNVNRQMPSDTICRQYTDLYSRLHSLVVSLSAYYHQRYSHDHDSSHLVKNSTLAVLKDIITTGYLEISDSAGTYYYGRQQDDCTSVRLTIINDDFWLRVFL